MLPQVLFETGDSDESDRYWSAGRLKGFLSLSTVLFTCIITLGPLGVLFLVPMEKGTAFGVMVGFVLMFSAINTFFMGIPTAHSLLSQCGFLAVLVACLAQLGDGCRAG